MRHDPVMILTGFGMRKYTVRSVTADTFSRLSCIVISLPMTMTVTVLVYALDTWTHDVSCRGGSLACKQRGHHRA